MASFGSALLFVLLRGASLDVHATQSEVYTFESYADSSCSVSALTKTDYLKKVDGSNECFVYTDVNGDVANGASSIALTCSDGSDDYTEYESGSCTGSTFSSGTERWFTSVICSYHSHFDSGSAHGTVYTSHASSSCTKSYLPTR